MQANELHFASGEARIDLFTGACGVVFTVGFVWQNPDMWGVALVLFVGTGYWLWRGVRAWKSPYVQLGTERLVVFDHGHPKHYVELAAVAAVCQGLNRTVLLMRDGMKIPISHLSFLRSEDAQHFRQALAERLARTA